MAVCQEVVAIIWCHGDVVVGVAAHSGDGSVLWEVLVGQCGRGCVAVVVLGCYLPQVLGIRSCVAVIALGLYLP